MTTATHTHPEPLVPQRLIVEQALFAAMIWAGATLFSFTVTFVVSLFTEIQVSGWHLAGQASRWFGFAIGIYAGYTYFPLYVTHGGTRRGFFAQSIVFTLAYGLVLGLLFSATFPLEALLYAAFGWTHQLHEPALYSGPMDLPMVLLQWALIMLMWVAGGVMIGAAWYRHAIWGALAIPVGILAAGISGLIVAGDTGPMQWLWERLAGTMRPGLLTGVAAHLLVTAGLLGLAWLAFRDAPIRNKRA